MGTAPTLVSYTETAWNTNFGGGGTASTASISWQTGDVIVVIHGCEGTSSPVLGGPTATGLSFSTPVSNLGGGTTCATRLSYAVAASSGSGAVTCTGSGSLHWGSGVWVWRGSAGIGTSVEQHTSTKTKSLTPAGSGTDSAICWGVFDFAATALTGINATPTSTNVRQRALDSTHYSLYVSDLIDQSSGGAVSYGISGGSGTGPFSIVAIEVKGSSSRAVSAGAAVGSSLAASGAVAYGAGDL